MELCCKSRKERETEERKNYIMDIAEHLFATTGYHNTSVSDIAKEAEFGIGTLYKYFKDKDTLFREIIIDRMEDYFNRIEEVFATDREPAEKIKDYIKAYVGILAEKKEFFKIYFTYVEPMLVDADQEANSYFEDIVNRNMQMFESLGETIQQGIEKKQLRDIDPGYFASALYGVHISVYYMHSYKHPEGNWDIDEIEDAVKTVIFDNLLIDGSYR